MRSTKEIVANLNAYIRQIGGPARTWYVGVAADPRARLFSDHKVDEQSGHWIIDQASSADVAREVEKLYLEKGYAGGPGGGRGKTVYVYAYRITPTTIQ
jgi:hypothetical protein